MERRLAAVVFLDVVGYSRLMGADEILTHELLTKVLSELIAPKTAQYRGRIIKSTGDGQLIEFPSIVDAVTFAVEVQTHMHQLNEGKSDKERIVFRVGINIGDVIVEPDDIYGDGVNLAARLESVAKPGGIYLSQSAYDQVFGKVDIDIQDLGVLDLKNIVRPGHTYSILLNDKARALMTAIQPLSGMQNKSKQRVVIIIHGFPSTSKWLGEFSEKLSDGSSVEIRSIEISLFSKLLFMVPGFSTNFPMEQVKQAIQSTIAAHQDSGCKISMFAHGFGTHVATKVLQENPHFSVDNLLLIRSVVRSDFDWQQVKPQITGTIVNECLTKDAWPLIVQSFNWNFGSTGICGFKTKSIQNRFHQLSHKEMLNPDNYTQYWTPYFEGAKVAQEQNAPVQFSSPRYFWLFRTPLKLVIGLSITISMLLTFGLVQFVINNFNFNKNNIICQSMRMAGAPSGAVNIGAVAWFEKDSGALSKWAIERSVDRLTTSGDYTIKPRIILKDSEGQRENVEDALEEFRSSDVVAVIGPMTSELAFYAKKWGNRNNTPVVTANASAAYLTQEGTEDYFFRVSMSDAARVKALVDWMVGKKESLSPYIIHEWKVLDDSIDEPESYGMQQASVAIQHMPKTVLETTTVRFTRHDVASMDAAAQRISDDPNRPIAIFGYTDNIVHIIQRLQERGVTNEIFLTGTYNKKIAEAGFPHNDKIHVISDVISEEGYATHMADFKVEYDSDDGKPEGLNYDVVAAYAYDATSIVLDAVQEAFDQSCRGIVDGNLVAEQLRLTPPKERKIVNTTFLHNRQEVFISLARYKVGDDEKLFRASE